jgi:hypothetical protein
MNKTQQSRASAWKVIYLILSAALTALYITLYNPGLFDGSVSRGILELILTALVVFAVTGIVVLFIYDKSQTNEPIERMFPVLFWGRKLFTKLGPLFRQ